MGKEGKEQKETNKNKRRNMGREKMKTVIEDEGIIHRRGIYNTTRLFLRLIPVGTLMPIPILTPTLIPILTLSLLIKLTSHIPTTLQTRIEKAVIRIQTISLHPSHIPTLSPFIITIATTVLRTMGIEGIKEERDGTRIHILIILNNAILILIHITLLEIVVGIGRDMAVTEQEAIIRK